MSEIGKVQFAAEKARSAVADVAARGLFGALPPAPNLRASLVAILTVLDSLC